ncbi:MAG: phosphotransferase [Haliea sp.]|nr:phosphotransferase [Haliea sp.]
MSFTSDRVGAGQTGASYRLALDTERGPETLIAKVAAGDPAARGGVSMGYAAEVQFYASLRDSVDIHTPDCRWRPSPRQPAFYAVAEDLSPRRPGVQAEGCSVDMARGALRNLAGLRAALERCEPLHAGVPMTIANAEAAAGLAQITEMAAAEFVNRYAIQLGAEDAAPLTAAAAVSGRWVLTSPKPFALLHGDYRLDNLMFGADPQDVAVLDWQTISAGPPARDLAYFLGTGLAVELRRVAETELVAVYHDELLRRGVADYGFEQCFRDYRLGQLQAPMITTIGCIYAPRERSDASDAMFLAMARRSCAAIRDLGTLDLL